jgi:hypothetical protein
MTCKLRRGRSVVVAAVPASRCIKKYGKLLAAIGQPPAFQRFCAGYWRREFGQRAHR